MLNIKQTIHNVSHSSTYLSSPFRIIFFNLMPWELRQFGFRTSDEYAPSSHATLILKSTLDLQLLNRAVSSVLTA